MRRSGAPLAPDAALVTWAKAKGAQRLVGANARAQALGLRAGLNLADARAMHPSLAAVPADPPGERAGLRHALDWCRRFTPLAALDGADGLMLDVSGVAHLFGGEAGLCAQIEDGLARQNFCARAGIGPNPEAAWAIARFSRQKILAPEATAADLPKIFADFPLAALGLDEAKLADLAQAGLRRVGDVVLRPRAPIAARYGVALFARLDALLGGSKSAISPAFEAPAFISERRFAEGLTQYDAIEATLAVLARDLCGLLASAGMGARRLKLTLFRVDGAVKHVELGASQALRDALAMARLFKERFASLGEEGLDTGYGFDVLRLAAIVVEPMAGAQTQAVDQDGALRVAPDDDIADLIDRLGARMGLRRVLRLRQNDTHRPEFAVSRLPAAHFAPARATPDPELERPIRLLQKPEPIETIALAPDGPPARFRWRRMLHEVVAVEGPERISPDANGSPEWRQVPTDALTRDYFHAEDSRGRRFWLFREGLQPSETTRPHWFMHGLFA